MTSTALWFFSILGLLAILDGALYILVPGWKRQIIARFAVEVSDTTLRLYGIVFVITGVLFLILARL